MLKNKSFKISKKVIAVCLGIVAIIVVSLLVRNVYFKHNKLVITKPVETKETINYSPATPQEKADSEANKKAAAERINQDANSTSNTDKRSVSVVITRAEQNGFQVEVNAFVSGVIEDNGTCTLKLTAASDEITKTSAGNKDATTTICTPFSVTTSELKPGRWKASITYSSATSIGTASQQIEFSVN